MCTTPTRKRPACRRSIPKAGDAASEKTAQVAKEFIAQATKLLAAEKKANGLTLAVFGTARICRHTKKCTD